MNIQTGGKVSGVYGIKVLRNAGTDKEHLEDFGESPNMLLDGFFERFASGDLGTSNWYMYVGAGADAVLPTQSSLSSQIGAGINSSNSGTLTQNPTVNEGGQYTTSFTISAEWGIGDIVGNISEVGVSMGSNRPTNLDSRALISDAQGNPTTITVTSQDKLIVSYTLRYIIPTQQQTSLVDFLGVDTICTLETTNIFQWSIRTVLAGFSPLCNFSSVQSLVNDVEEGPASASSSDVVQLTKSSPQPNTIRLSYFASTNHFNLYGSIKYLSLNTYDGSSNRKVLGLHFDPPIPKDNTKTLTLNFDFTLTRA